MINNRPNVSRYPGVPPPASGDSVSRQIAGGPIYPVPEVVALAERAAILFWTGGAARDTQKWAIDTDGASELLLDAVNSGRFLGAEWCEQKTSGPWAACDAYTVTRREWNRAAHKHLYCTYYIKFAIGKTGQILLMASIHPTGA